MKKLTNREKEVCELMAQGLNNKEIAEKMFVGKRTVATHIQHIYEKFLLLGHQGTTSKRCLAVKYYLEQNELLKDFLYLTSKTRKLNSFEQGILNEIKRLLGELHNENNWQN